MKKSAKDFLLHGLNALIAGGLVFLGGVSSGEITLRTLEFSLVAGAAVALVQFRDYIDMLLGHTKSLNTTKLFKFL